ncbi:MULTISPECIES: ADP-ribosylglycohydrolase family protein [unclassified Nocardiopsis]|uniref:ADP-ribosylglycohydrolase family protein n=1 Tax=unclassified Nocardiopsis TaxID=2649073 RepID=UPI00135844C5|nr:MULTISPECIES: ADP-ribosylglycohydrolase family protein [unclassified Nocardiopsis]
MISSPPGPDSAIHRTGNDPSPDRDGGCLLAAACADAFGHAPSGDPESRAPLRPTGSTSLMAVLAAHLRAREGGGAVAIDQDRLVREFTQVWRRDPERGFGGGEIRIFLSVVNGIPWRSASSSAFGGTGSYGAGAAARVAPVGLLRIPLNRLVRLARDSAYVTHAHPLAIDGAALQACAVAYVRRADPRRPLPAFHLLSTVARHATAPEFRAQLARLSALGRAGYTPRDVVGALGGGAGAVEAVPAALAAFLHAPDDLPEVVRFAACLGAGAGNVAAMAGALAGARLGSGAVPGSWLRRLEEVPGPGARTRVPLPADGDEYV